LNNDGRHKRGISPAIKIFIDVSNLRTIPAIVSELLYFSKISSMKLKRVMDTQQEKKLQN
jgi:hypothetical protein